MSNLSDSPPSDADEVIVFMNNCVDEILRLRRYADLAFTLNALRIASLMNGTK